MVLFTRIAGGYMSRFRKILGFSGGGVRGVISATWLEHLVKNKFINPDELYSISGTSTGSIIAAALCKPDPYSPSDIAELFSELSSQVFKRKTWRPAWLDSILFFAPHDTKKLKEVLSSNLGSGVKVGDCRRNFVCVTYSLNDKFDHKQKASGPLIIHSFPTPFRANSFHDYSLADVVTGSCAAPSYFQPHIFQHRERNHIFTDGGICSNASILSNFLTCRDRYTGESVRRKDISALLIGNGTSYTHISKKSLSGWKTPGMLRAVKDSLVQANEIYEIKSMRRLLRNNFYYFNCPLPKPVDLDDYRKVSDMARFAEEKTKHMGMVKSWLRGYFV